MAEKVHAPFTEEQVASLNMYQQAEVFHPFTCPNCSDSPSLHAAMQGWVCLGCGYTQDWAHDWMSDWSWQDFT